MKTHLEVAQKLSGELIGVAKSLTKNVTQLSLQFEVLGELDGLFAHSQHNRLDVVDNGDLSERIDLAFNSLDDRAVQRLVAGGDGVQFLLGLLLEPNFMTPVNIEQRMMIIKFELLFPVFDELIEVVLCVELLEPAGVLQVDVVEALERSKLHHVLVHHFMAIC